MKNLTLWTIILILFTSCSIDNDSAELNENQSIPTASNETSKTGMYPENSANAYDIAGQLYYDISESFLALGVGSGTTATTISHVESVANANDDFLTILPTTYVSPTSTRIDYILNNQQVTALDIILNSNLTTEGKASMTGFMNSLMVFKDQAVEYDDVYKYIIIYETAVIVDKNLTANDKKILLTTSSISRYGFFFAKKRKKKKPRDRDWDISWGHIVSAMDGSEANIAKAIVMSVAVGVITND